MRLVALLSVGACFFLALGCSSSSRDDSSEQSSAEVTADDGAHYVHCADDMTQVTFERTATEYSLRVREEAYKGQTLGLVLDPTVAPTFFQAATGKFIELTVHIQLDNGDCRFSAAHDTLFLCGNVYPTAGMPPVATITDGVTTATLDDTTPSYSMESRHVVGVDREQDETVLHFELFGPTHPWPTGYIREAAFAPDLCTTTRPPQ